MPTTIVVGAGWAGLSCAYELSKAGHKVTVLEAAPQIGGRARSIKYNNILLDNGQHIAIGAYKYMRQLIKELGLEEQELFKISHQKLIIKGNKKNSFTLELASLPPPYNLLFGIICKSKLPWKFKVQICRFAYAIKKINFKLPIDCSIFELLKSYYQSTAIITILWEPLAVAIMSTPIRQASAQIFLNVLRQVFDASNDSSNWLFPALDLSSILPQHLANYVHKHGSQIECNQAVKRVTINNSNSVLVHTNNKVWQANHIVLATPPWQAKTIIQDIPELQANYKDLNSFTFEAITTIYYIFASPIELPYPLISILDSTCEWVLDRKFTGQPNILSAVITGQKNITFVKNTKIAQQVFQEILKHFPWLPEPVTTKIICEKRAAFSCVVAIQQQRPEPNTAIQNLWLCGDYLKTGYPATLEGALISGKKTAQALFEYLLNISPRSNQNC